jgi:hypothetical protein
MSYDNDYYVSSSVLYRFAGYAVLGALAAAGMGAGVMPLLLVGAAFYGLMHFARGLNGERY